MAKVAACLAVLVIVGCSSTRVPLTMELAGQLSDEEIRNLQFYVSSKVVLRRDLATSGKSVTPGHRVLIEHGREIEEVVIKKGVPGVAVGRAKIASLSVSFEPPIKDREFFLVFEAASNQYLLRMSKVEYGGEVFEVADGAQKALLMIDAEVVDRVDSRRRQAPGRVLDPARQ